MSKVTVDSDIWIRRPSPAPDASTRLFCFPHAGGAASFFHPMARRLRPGTEVLAVQYPGRQDRRHEPLLTDIQTLADRATAAVLPFTDAPYAFFGHSMGAIVAFEVARRLQAAGAPQPSILFASARRAPSRRRDERVHLLDDAGLVAEITTLGGTAATLLTDPDVLAMVLPVCRADYRAIERYRCAPHTPPLGIPITVLIGDRDPRVTPAEAEAWGEHTTGPLDIYTVRGGDHFYLTNHLNETADHITAQLGSVG
ncbi:thioesterase II family protein [Streptomyces sp. NPDC057307]|uniref:thioesterase II family protein n=1 Tax=Streptomyces sp. NPDC057307 TaxID=3346096 RepID=UPI00362DA2E7